MRPFSCPGALAVVFLCGLPDLAQAQITIATDQPVGTAFAVAVEPGLHFVNRALAGVAGTLSADGLGFGASARGMIFPLARPDGALGFGIQGSLSHSQLSGGNGGLSVASGGIRYVLGQPRLAYWLDANLGYGTGPELGAAPWVDVGVGWQFALTPSFMWGIVGRWGLFFPERTVADSCGAADLCGESEYNYSLFTLALTLEWGPSRWQQPQVTPVAMAQLGPQQPGAQPQAQAVPVQPNYPAAQPSSPPAPPQPLQPQGQPQSPQPTYPAQQGGPPQANPTPAQPPVQLYSTAGSDRDGDGVPDANDACLDYAEDRNGHDDTDGCPDADRDGDHVPDVLDQCPSRPEDFDSRHDDDGCPE